MEKKFPIYNENLPLIQPRGGRSNEILQGQLWNDLELAGCDVLPLTIDSKTRLGQIKLASEAYDKSKSTRSETLNGFPLLSVPINVAEELVSSTRLPVSLRHGTPYAFDLIERAIKVGIYEIEGGPLSYSLPYSRDSNLEKVIDSWRLSEILCSNSDFRVVRETFGILTACLVPPLQAILVNVLECAFIDKYQSGLPMASFGSTGSNYQDIATIEAFRIIYPWFRELINLPSTDFLIAFHHWMGPFPKDRVLAYKIIENGNKVALQTNSNKVVIKTTDEALGIPSNKANATAVSLTKKFFNQASILTKISDSRVVLEVTNLVNESEIQLTKLANSGKSLEKMLLQSVTDGLIDPPFAPHRDCQRMLKTLRAPDGSVRVSPDYPGVFTKIFVESEKKFLPKDYMWSKLNSDRIAQDIAYPFTIEEY